MLVGITMKQINCSLSIAKLATVSVLALILAGCAFPKRDAKGMPDASVIKVQLQNGVWVAVPPECASLFTEFARPKFNSRPQYSFGCATYTNLANSVARPQDLIRPSTYAGQQADHASEAVTRYRQNEVTPLRETSSTTKE